MIADLILVDTQDNPIGSMEKMEAHQKGLLHRAFSVFIYLKSKNNLKLLIQRRAAHKYHSANLLTNSVCSHPAPGESIEKAVYRRVKEELGIDLTQKPFLNQFQIQKMGYFIYNAELDSGLIEHELDHVINIVIEPDLDSNISDIDFQNLIQNNINPEEISEIFWEDPNNILKKLEQNPQNYTVWFGEAFGCSSKALI